MSLSDFQISDKGQALACPQGHVPAKVKKKKRNSVDFDSQHCQQCPNLSSCPVKRVSNFTTCVSQKKRCVLQNVECLNNPMTSKSATVASRCRSHHVRIRPTNRRQAPACPRDQGRKILRELESLGSEHLPGKCRQNGWDDTRRESL